MKLSSVVSFFLVWCLGSNCLAVTNITFIGASITYGSGLPSREQQAYPAQLQRLLGAGYQVHNFGVSGCTLLRKGNKPYWDTKEYQLALASNPDIVFIDLGGNDAKLVNRPYFADLERDSHDFIRAFRALPSHPRVVVLLPEVSFVTDTTQIWDQVIVKKIIPALQRTAYADNAEVIDMHQLLVDKPVLFPDKLHPDTTGAGIMARRLYQLVSQERDTAFDIFAKLGKSPTSSFYGYACADFVMNNRNCKVVKPKWSAAGHPWIWRARFWGHEPQTDIALLERGFHVVYCDVAELLGNKTSNSLWDQFYTLMHGAGLSKKAVLEGMSRGGMYVFNWAAENPNKVAAVYVDNPLLNMSVWAMSVLKDPAKYGSLVNDFKADYNLTGEQLPFFKGNPTDKVRAIVRGKYPILVLVADDDEDVDPVTNTGLFEYKVKALKGNITVLHKPGFKHHPHSLPNPAVIVDFIWNAVF
ncbi:GDSL-type esterase/lipase family protein [Hufsiella ginkgonis]|uniref:SGNH hydrolase-type esterase domain-containing protein n=1 Tax=Hufsiella ginkgonis TaxID=2695274 RepID=A0A7K1Y356_9SPHI|nr:GDSL-type esterase/lipase family protein [Hufsiella ginkgonis]MXV17672.1 hypothetical protein [Hufsiella ginkgonis]